VSGADDPTPGRVVDARPGAAKPDVNVTPPRAPEPADPAEPADHAEPAEPESVARAAPEDPAAATEGAEDDPVEDAADVVEEDLDELATVAGERDEYLDQLRRLQADFENYRKRVQKQQEEWAERATEALARELLPVLDACDAAVAHGDASVEPVAKALLEALARQGLDPVPAQDEPFDPTVHEAVTHEEGDGGPVVAEVLRAGYTWKGRVLRPAMVRVRG